MGGLGRAEEAGGRGGSHFLTLTLPPLAVVAPRSTESEDLVAHQFRCETPAQAVSENRARRATGGCHRGSGTHRGHRAARGGAHGAISSRRMAAESAAGAATGLTFSYGNRESAVQTEGVPDLPRRTSRAGRGVLVKCMGCGGHEPAAAARGTRFKLSLPVDASAVMARAVWLTPRGADPSHVDRPSG